MSGTISSITFAKIVKPMRTTFVTALGSKTVATSVLVKVEVADGRASTTTCGLKPASRKTSPRTACGVGEVPTSFVMPHETVAAIAAILRQARGLLIGQPIDNYDDVLAKLRREHEAFHMTLAGLEVGLFRARLARDGESELAHWGGKCSRIETDITIPFLPDLDVLRAWLAKVAPVGFRTYKVKTSGRVNEDLRFVTAVHELLTGNPMAHGRELALTPAMASPFCAVGDVETQQRKTAKPSPNSNRPQSHVRLPFIIRLDGNQGYTAISALRMLDKLSRAKIDVELFEQPLHKDDHAGLRELTKRCPVPVILDETVFEPEQARRAIDDQLGHGINIKIAKSGIARSAEILRLARRAKWKLMIGCMTETLVGLSAGIYLAAGSGGFDYIDLDSAHLLNIRRRCTGITAQGPHYLLETP